jgi:acetoin utilization deacetylase AcuC-like enzyme
MTGLLQDPVYQTHDTGASHPEKPDRLRAIATSFARAPIDGIVALPAVEADPEWILRVHTPEHFDRVKRACDRGYASLDVDTHVSPGSFAAAMNAVGGVLRACDLVATGGAANAFCAVRPPGHHAEPAAAMGFCLFNNVAIAARYLQATHGVERILIIDWDVHHGNGTQWAFYLDPSVFYFSTHQSPLYPGTGSSAERGEEEGEGATLNVPLAPGTGDAGFQQAFSEYLVPACETFKPEFILISAGFDAHADDPLAHLRVSDAGFEWASRTVKQLAATYAEGRVVSVLEGGYDLETLARCVHRHVAVLAES